MKITCISDLHGCYPDLPGGDLLILAGDYTGSNRIPQWTEFFRWLEQQDYRKIVYVGGNHDGFLTLCLTSSESSDLFREYKDEDLKPSDKIEYLLDSGLEFEGLKIWGSPWSLWFHGINPHCKAFTGSEGDLKKKFDLIPDDTDILITHTPPCGVLDHLHRADGTTEYTGSKSLRLALERAKPQLHVFGHIHEHGGKIGLFKHIGPNTLCINASIMDRNYQPENTPITITL